MSIQRTCRAPIHGLALLVFLGGGVASFSAGAATQEKFADSFSLDNPANWIAPSNTLGAPDVNCTDSN